MKKIILFLFMLNIFLLTETKSFAVTASPTNDSPTPSKKTSPTTSEDVVSELKDRIASRVAELKLVERRGIYGVVTDVSDTRISLTDVRGDTRFIDVDELTKFSSPSAKGSFGISDIGKETNISVIGLFNKQSRRILARFVDTDNLPKTVHGVIVSKNEDDYTLKVISDEGKEATTDIETVTKIYSYTKADGLKKSGFSKIKEGTNVILVGFTDVKNKNKITSTRIITFPEIPKNPSITIPENALNPEETTIPSTGSGKKVTPIKK